MPKFLTPKLIRELEPEKKFKNIREKLDFSKDDIIALWIVDKWTLKKIAHLYNVRYVQIKDWTFSRGLFRHELLKQKGEIFKQRMLKNKPLHFELTPSRKKRLKYNPELMIRRCQCCTKTFLTELEKNQLYCSDCLKKPNDIKEIEKEFYKLIN